MMRIGYCLLAVVVATGTGCMDAHGLPFQRTAKNAPVPTAASPAARPPSPVTEDQVTEANAHAKVDALEQEINGAATRDTQPSAHKGCPDGH